jgi:site-specific recombinase XerD
MSGVGLTTIQKLMGHKTIQTTMHYARLAPDHLKSAVARIDVGINLAQAPKMAQKST